MATYVDLKQMLANDERLTSVFLTFSSRLDTEDFRKAVQNNTFIEEVVISADEAFFQECSGGGLHAVFEAIGRLPRLRKLSINSYPNSVGIVSMKAINHMLLDASNLRMLTISDVQVTGTPEDFEVFSQRVQRMLYLRAFCFVDCNIVLDASMLSPRQQQRFNKDLSYTSSTQANDLLNSLFLTLSILPSLEIVYLEAKEKGGFGSLSVAAATALCLSASIRILKLRKLQLTNVHITSMAQLLEMNCSIVNLELGSIPNLDSRSSEAFGKMLRVNTTLDHLELGLETMICDNSATEFASALRHNSHLRSFALTSSSTKNAKNFGRVTPKCRKAFLQMLQYNYFLEKFFLFRKSPLSREVKLYSNLNKMGRGDLMQSNTNCSEKWVSKLAEVKDDVNSIFYFLSNNPTLCSAPAVAVKRKASVADEDTSSCQPRPKKQRKSRRTSVSN